MLTHMVLVRWEVQTIYLQIHLLWQPRIYFLIFVKEDFSQHPLQGEAARRSQWCAAPAECRWFIAGCGVFLKPDFWVLHFQRKSEGRRDIEKPSLIHASLIISLVILLTTGDSSMSGSLVENELQLCERPCLSLTKHWQLKLEPKCIPFPSRPTKLQLTIWICLYSCSPDQLLGKNQVPGPYSMHWIISSPHATAPAKKNAACFSTSSFFVEVGRFRVSSCFQENSHCWWIIMYLYTLYIVRGIHILLQMHFVAVSDRHHYSVHQICRDTWKDSDCVWFLPLTKKAQWPESRNVS